MPTVLPKYKCINQLTLRRKTMANVPTPYAPKGNESIHDALLRFALELHGITPPTTPEMQEFREFCKRA